jgi:HlyD family secretion protein
MKTGFPARRPVPLAAIATAALALAALLTSCSKAGSDETPKAEVSVRAAPVTRQGITQHIGAEAVLSPIAEAAIAPKITAPVKKFYVQRGAKVHAGELLATLENADLQAAVTDNQGSLDAQRANYQSTVKAQVPEEYQRAELDLQQAAANLTLNQSIVNSRTKLFSEGAIPGRDLDTAEAALVAAKAAYGAASKHLAAMKQVSRAAALEQAKGQLESARGKYQGAEAQLSYSEIRTPIAGVVTDRPLFAGETAPAGAALVTVMDTSVLLAKLHLPQPQAQMLKVGDPAAVTIPGVEAPVAGKITLISPALDPGSTTVEVWVRIENPSGGYRPGTAVHVEVAGQRVPRALAVPSAAIIVTNSGQKAVMVIGGDGAAHQTVVTTGIVDGGETQILSGLSAGQQVVTEGAFALDDGTQVKVVTGNDDGQAGAAEEQQ